MKFPFQNNKIILISDEIITEKILASQDRFDRTKIILLQIFINHKMSLFILSILSINQTEILREGFSRLINIRCDYTVYINFFEF